MIQIIQGDCVQKLTRLKPRTVNTCITSHPYWLLIDYGTGTWVGGKADCDHLGDTMRAWTIKTSSNDNQIIVGTGQMLNFKILEVSY